MRNLSSVLFLSFGILGCSVGEAPPKLIPVTGTLVVGGKPLENITVQLMPVDTKAKVRPGIGKTDAEGKFTILTNGDKGANVGKFKVVLQSVTAALRDGADHRRGSDEDERRDDGKNETGGRKI